MKSTNTNEDSHLLRMHESVKSGEEQTIKSRWKSGSEGGVCVVQVLCGLVSFKSRGIRNVVTIEISGRSVIGRVGTIRSLVALIQAFESAHRQGSVGKWCFFNSTCNLKSLLDDQH